MTIEEMRHLDAVKTYKELEEAKAEIQMLKTTIKRLEEFANRFLNPDDLGWAIGKHDRDEAREALGKERVESK